MSTFEEVFAAQSAKVGTEVGVSKWIEIDQSKIDIFADVTQDPQWIHVDPERAKAETPFGGTIAHGFLTLSMASKFSIDTFEKFPGQTMGINYGFEKVRFLNPVCAGDSIRGRFVLNKITRKGDTRFLQELGLTIEIKGKETPACVAQWLGMAIFEPAG